MIQAAALNYWITEYGDLWRMRMEAAVAYSHTLAQHYLELRGKATKQLYLASREVINPRILNWP
jgi:hypothetical protein